MSEFAEFRPDRPERERLQAGEGFAVRPVVEDDLDAVAAIIAEREGEVFEKWREISARILAEVEGGRTLFLVAESGLGILGYGRAAWFEPPGDSPEEAAPAGWYLTGVVVRPEARRRGVGEALTRERLAWISLRAEAAWYFANAQNRVTIALHERLGFEEVTRDFWFPGVQFRGGVGVLFRRDLSGD